MSNDPRSVIFGVPLKNFTVSREFWQSSLQTVVELGKRGIPCGFRDIGGDMYIDKVRSKLATIFYEDFPEVDNFFFLDDDLGWDAMAVVRAVERPEPIIVGIYPLKQDDLDFPVRLMEDETGNLIEKDGLYRALQAPTGFMRIKRSALEAYAEVYDEIFFDAPGPDGKFRRWRWLFDHGVCEQSRSWLGEDVSFVRRCIDLGIEVWADPNNRFGHRGSYVWYGCLADHLKEVGSFGLSARKE